MRVTAVVLGIVLAVPGSAEDATETGTILAPEVTLEEELRSLKATYRDLFGIIEQTRSIVATANSGVDDEDADESIRLGDGSFTVTLKRGFSEDDFGGAPEVASDVYYVLQNREAPISSVRIRLVDSSRQLMISGHSREQVTALHGFLVDALESHGVLMGGSAFRLVGALILQLSASVLFISGLLLTHRSARALCLVFAPLLYLSVWVLPWNAWFPGTAIYIDSASFIVRNSEWVALSSLIATLLALVIGIAHYPFRQPTAARDAPPTAVAKWKKTNSGVKAKHSRRKRDT